MLGSFMRIHLAQLDRDKTMFKSIFVVKRPYTEDDQDKQKITDAAMVNIADFCDTKNITLIANAHAIESHTVIIALGGDGTVMNACRLAIDHTNTIIGFNYGSLGFLTNFNKSDDIFDVLYTLYHKTGDFDYQDRYILTGESTNDIQQHTINHAVNEFHIASKEGLLEYTVDVDGEETAMHSADGVIICTPTGSTAYGLAAGGAIMMPSMKGMQVIPVAPHMLTSRPLIVSDEQHITIIIANNRGIIVKIDGIELDGIESDTGVYTFKFSIGRKKVRLLRKKDKHSSFFQAMSDKLFYGRRGTN